LRALNFAASKLDELKAGVTGEILASRSYIDFARIRSPNSSQLATRYGILNGPENLVLAVTK